MKVTDLWTSDCKPTVSFEVFPARSEKAAANLEKAVDKLAALNPDFMSVTFGAGGSTRDGSRQLIEKLMNEKGQKVIAYFACYGLGPEDITAVLNRYRDMGVGSVLAVRGDPPREDEFKPHPDSLAYASDLVSLIRSKYDFCLGVAGYPEGHVKAPGKEQDIEYLKLKVERGAQYIITNYFYDNSFFFDFVERCRVAGIQVPIVPGVMPIYSAKMLNMLAGLCGATITAEVKEGLAALPADDKKALTAFGIEFATRQCRDLLERGVPGLHIYTMDRSASAVGIVQGLRADGLLPKR